MPSFWRRQARQKAEHASDRQQADRHAARDSAYVPGESGVGLDAWYWCLICIHIYIYIWREARSINKRGRFQEEHNSSRHSAKFWVYLHPTIMAFTAQVKRTSDHFTDHLFVLHLHSAQSRLPRVTYAVSGLITWGCLSKLNLLCFSSFSKDVLGGDP